MARTSRPVTVTLGDLKEHADPRVKSGAYASASEMIRAALADPRPNVPARKVFKRLREHHARRAKTGRAREQA